MANPTYRTATAVPFTSVPTGGVYSATWGASVQAGDGLLVFMVNATNASVPTPTGYTPVIATTEGTGAAGYVNIFKKVAVAGDASATVSITFTATGKAAMLLLAYSGTDPGDPIHLIQKFNETTSQLMHASPALTTTIANTLILQVVAEKDSSSAPSWTDPGSTTNRAAIQPGGGGQQVLRVVEANAIQTGAGAASVGSFTSDTATAAVATFTIALAPSSGTSNIRPTSDVTTTGWNPVPSGTAAGSYYTLVADDDPTTYVESPGSPTTSVFEVKLPTLASAPTSYEVSYYHAGGAATTTCVHALMQGATVIATHTESAVTTTEVKKTYTTTSGERAAITDLTNLRIRVTVTVA